MTGAEAIYVPMIIGAVAGAGTAAARGQGAQGIALSGLAGGATGGVGGWAAGPATAGATGATAGTAGGTGAAAAPLLSSPAIGASTAFESGLSSYMGGAGPLLSSPAIGAQTGPLSSAFESGLSSYMGAGPGSIWAPWKTPDSRQLIASSIKEVGQAGVQASEEANKRRQALIEAQQAAFKPPGLIQGEDIPIQPVQVQSIPAISQAGISQDILRRYISSLKG